MAFSFFGAPGRITPGILPSAPSGPSPLRCDVQFRSRRNCRTNMYVGGSNPKCQKKGHRDGWPFHFLARPEGFEPPTLWFVARYSIQLSYGRLKSCCYYYPTGCGCEGANYPFRLTKSQPVGASLARENQSLKIDNSISFSRARLAPTIAGKVSCR